MMPRKDEIDRMIVMLYISRNAHGFVNFTRPDGWMDKLPMAGLAELQHMFSNMSDEVQAETSLRLNENMPRYSRRHYEEDRAEQNGGAEMLSSIGVKTNKEGE